MKCPVCSNKQGFKPLSPEVCIAPNFLCPTCGLVFISRNEGAAEQYYKNDGYFKKSLNFAYRKKLISKSLLVKEAGERVANALSMLSADLGNKNVLDVGCGYGEILYCFEKNHGCQVQGVEASREASQHGKKLFDIPIHTTTLEEFDTREKFDIVWCSHVLEHTSDPKTFLKKVKAVLKKGGQLYLEVPNILKPSGNFDLDMFLHKEHLQTFSVYNLCLLLSKTGFKVMTYSDSTFLKFWCRPSRNQSIQIPKITSRETFAFLKKYKKEYNLASHTKVYLQKALYGAKLILYKTRDVF
ncbi:MAG: hypothetical protein A3D26_00590 [Candidatus Blackburnbacteria bacterium RIFCSPHIGHO2_02_FULL_44_20]|uniref:Methyltransferase type 11 domain-containing protein n=1 Tax=Candidatus Blackburnbacteria bacterium RIFCSPHIGHO2_02_FULL_44_20 TaxID=1797516 RepID=A0A1G1V9L9_9BACT|nr:MAG: hypothetical protein A3E16_02840 [Candidatus Blackburnbacteria bacterium RIFCSPHIGHO2_12_FULL_44_25]OGY12007.1 MAG: hypothetical protein A3D26_00590 [Candidatus Blackburnbacteria bacterium RIFCSPHIGHO2_02_FULL_44_20]